ncbi:GNAT family N-acetyltransferase [Chitinispirillales bacterium ANBcel5]|uniref:GNAT family N-acetyltransferase n=1 Tax=Cellulosispirillum alkaliphilum TaxID=3039283 RepID=UPI002A594B06|nr:GNAT family N-acetyltransferase [Chitinispirillales bacterium ANBcel5]
MGAVEIRDCDSENVEKCAEVVAESFKNEVMTEYLFDFSKDSTYQAYRRNIANEARGVAESGCRVLAALRDGEVSGVALIKSNRKLPLGKRITLLMKRLRCIAPMVLKIRIGRALSVRNTIPAPKSLKGNYIILLALAVHPKYQNQGIGKKLLSQIHSISENDPDSSGVYLFTADKKNQILYEKVGYKTIDERHAGDLTVYHMFRENRNAQKAC